MEIEVSLKFAFSLEQIYLITFWLYLEHPVKKIIYAIFCCCNTIRKWSSFNCVTKFLKDVWETKHLHLLLLLFLLLLSWSFSFSFCLISFSFYLFFSSFSFSLSVYLLSPSSYYLLLLSLLLLLLLLPRPCWSWCGRYWGCRHPVVAGCRYWSGSESGTGRG